MYQIYPRNYLSSCQAYLFGTNMWCRFINAVYIWAMEATHHIMDGLKMLFKIRFQMEFFLAHRTCIFWREVGLFMMMKAAGRVADFAAKRANVGTGILLRNMSAVFRISCIAFKRGYRLLRQIVVIRWLCPSPIIVILCITREAMLFCSFPSFLWNSSGKKEVESY